MKSQPILHWETIAKKNSKNTLTAINKSYPDSFGLFQPYLAQSILVREFKFVQLNTQDLHKKLC